MATRRRSVPAASLPVDIEEARRFAVTRLPGAEVTRKFGNASFSINGKVFAFTRPDGLVLKLPPDVLADTLTLREAQPLVMGKRVMREWVLVTLPSRESYIHELPLLRIAMAFCSAATS